MMKKMIAGAVLAGMALRLTVLAGGGEALRRWVADLDLDARTVTAALELELGGLPAAEGRRFTLSAGGGTVSFSSGGNGQPTADPLAALSLPAAEGAAESGPEPEWDDAGAVEQAAAAVIHRSGDVELRNSTSFSVDLSALAAEGPGLRLRRGEPQVLVIHTHSSEAYTQDAADRYEASDPYRTEDKRYSVIRVGDALAQKLEEQGLTVLHDRELYDYPSYTGSYNRSGAAVEQYLKTYPSVQVVIDLHRDAIGSGSTVYKTQADLDGPSCAQVMLLVGTGENGLYHPNWRENLKLAIYLQSAADSRFPSLTRPIALVSERYNQQLSAGSMILEVGSTGNTLQEAILAAERFGEAAGAALAACLEGP